MSDPLTDSQIAEAAHAAAISKEADHKAVTAAMYDVLHGFFADQTEKERFISTQRIPFICKDIQDIKGAVIEIKKLQESQQEKADKKYVSNEVFWPVKALVFGFVGLVLVAVVTAILALVIVSSPNV